MVGKSVDAKLLDEVNKKEELYINVHKDRAKTNCVLALQDGCQCQCGGISHAYLYIFYFMTHSGEYSSQMKKFISAQLDQAGRDLEDEEKRVTTIQKTKHSKESMKKYILRKELGNALVRLVQTGLTIHDYVEDKVGDTAISCATELYKQFSKTARDVFLENENGYRIKLGQHMVKTHVYCDIPCTVSQYLSRISDINVLLSTSDIELIVDEIMQLFIQDRTTMRGFGLSGRTRPKKKRETFNELDVKFANNAADGAGIDLQLMDRICVSRLLSTCIEMLEESTDLDLASLIQALNIVSVLCCPDVCAHKRVWDQSFIPLYYSKICDPFRPELSQDANKLLEHFRIDTWDDGSVSFWKEPMVI